MAKREERSEDALTICIVNWNTRKHLARCLESLRQACRGIRTECVVVDNASSDGSAEMVRDRFPEVRLYALDRNLGFAEANNVAIRGSTGRFVLLLNPDIYAAETSIRELLAFLEATADAAGVGASLVGHDGRVQTPFYRRFPTRTQVLLFYTGLSYITWWIPSLKHRYFDVEIQGEDPIEVDQLPGACCLLRREVIEEVGLLDPDYFIWFEDVDWCYRMRQSGHRLFVLPRVRMLHAGGASFRGWSSDRRVWQFFLAMFRFFSKHRFESLMRWSLAVVSADLLLKQWTLRALFAVPGASRLPLPRPATLRSLRGALRELVRRHAAGEVIRLGDAGPLTTARGAHLGEVNAAEHAGSI